PAVGAGPCACAGPDACPLAAPAAGKSLGTAFAARTSRDAAALRSTGALPPGDSGDSDERRGDPCWISPSVPAPLSERPGRPCGATLAAWLGFTSAYWPDLKSLTSTWPRNTSTRVSLGSTVTRNCVPFTIAAR